MEHKSFVSVLQACSGHPAGTVAFLLKLPGFIGHAVAFPPTLYHTLYNNIDMSGLSRLIGQSDASLHEEALLCVV